MEQLENVPFKWEDTKKVTLNAREMLGPLQSMQQEKVKEETEDFRLRVADFVKDFHENAPFSSETSTVGPNPNPNPNPNPDPDPDPDPNPNPDPDPNPNPNPDPDPDPNPNQDDSYKLINEWNAQLNEIELEAKAITEGQELFEVAVNTLALTLSLTLSLTLPLTLSLTLSLTLTLTLTLPLPLTRWPSTRGRSSRPAGRSSLGSRRSGTTCSSSRRSSPRTARASGPTSTSTP